LEISGNPVQLTGRWIGSFTITAKGGTVTYTITLPSPATTYGDPAVSSTSATLTNGQTATVSVQDKDPAVATEHTYDLTVDPGDIQVQVEWPVDE
jgi:hypothetical protein